MIYFNNCRGKDHVASHGKNAFYDLFLSQPQLRRLSRGEACVVATRAKDKKVTLRYYSFSKEEMGRYDGRPCRIFFGESLKERGPFTQIEAARIEPAFFNKNGGFNRWAVLER